MALEKITVRTVPSVHVELIKRIRTMCAGNITPDVHGEAEYYRHVGRNDVLQVIQDFIANYPVMTMSTDDRYTTQSTTRGKGGAIIKRVTHYMRRVFKGGVPS